MENYFVGLSRTISIASGIDEAISENQVDAIMESVTRYCESKIDDLPL